MTTNGAAHRGTTDIAFIAVTQAHQFLHWLPAALRLAAEPNVRVTVLASTRAGADFIRSFDPERRLRIERLWAFGANRDALFDPPARLPVLLLNAPRIARFPVIVTTETTSSWLRRLPGFRSKMIHLKHGAGDREGGYNPKHAGYDLTLVNGPKDKQRLIERGLGTEDNIRVVGYAKFELIRPASDRLFANERPVALYNPHFDKQVGTWLRHGRDIVRAMETIPDWNFIVAPHVKLRGGPDIRSNASSIIVDRGSVRSIDMTYTQAAEIYIGDVSSQVYEFIRTPRPCIFLNLDRVEWQKDPAYSHWHFGQVIETLDALPAALAHAEAMQPQFEALQRTLLEASIDQGDIPASERQAQAILEFMEFSHP
ncbi:MAG TPA: CDP-glycerol glycerophosphotransferase family protein [Burkholderiales bacterium]|nr:CDP-glycerol glycerophosphotransferase family protein [Burkholderiales bacterium]